MLSSISVRNFSQRTQGAPKLLNFLSFWRITITEKQAWQKGTHGIISTTAKTGGNKSNDEPSN